MASFPALFSGVVALYPLVATARFPATVLQFTDYKEQRFVRAAGLRRFLIELSGIRKADKDSLQTFFDTVKGGFDHTWDITVSGDLYENMVFETDSFSCRETGPEHWTLSLPCRQVRKN